MSVPHAMVPGGKNDNSTFPRLARQQKEYIETPLKAFRDVTRADSHAHAYMWGIAARLTDPTIEGLAAYYSAQLPASGSSADLTLVAAGQEIFQEGVPAAEIPAWVTCHGEKAEGNGPYPRLAGQHRAYLERQLEAFASNARANEIMHENAKNLRPSRSPSSRASSPRNRRAQSAKHDLPTFPLRRRLSLSIAKYG